MQNLYINGAVVPAAAPTEFKRTFYTNSFLDSVRVRFYPGQELDLDLTVYIIRYGGGYINIVAGGTMSQAIAGDDDTLIFNCGIEIKPGEQILVLAHNKTTVPEGEQPSDYTYNFQVICEMSEFDIKGRAYKWLDKYTKGVN